MTRTDFLQRRHEIKEQLHALLLIGDEPSMKQYFKITHDFNVSIIADRLGLSRKAAEDLYIANETAWLWDDPNHLA